jgi:hypothetical protein
MPLLRREGGRDARFAGRPATGEGTGDGHPLLFAAGELVREVVDPIGQAHLLEPLAGERRSVLATVACERAARESAHSRGCVTMSA